MSPPRPRLRVLGHAPGPAGHGVVRHARLLAGLVAGHGVEPVRSGSAALAHVQFTDRLFGPDIDTATAAFLSWAGAAPRPLVVTLHDLPGADPDRVGDEARERRRRRGYAAVVAAADVVVVSSRHEADLATALGARAPRLIGLPIVHRTGPATVPGWAGRSSLGVLGFVYPGKGHAEAIRAAARRSPRPLVVAAGALAEGHRVLGRELRELAAEVGVEFLVTGSLSDDELAGAATAVTVPVAPARAVSASGSLASWLGAGRRPVAARGAYTAELTGRHPGRLTLYDDEPGLDAALERGFADPAATRFDATELADSAAACGAAHAALYRHAVAGRC